eukprot:5259280-Prymnesium_polylepis.1
MGGAPTATEAFVHISHSLRAAATASTETRSAAIAHHDATRAVLQRAHLAHRRTRRYVRRVLPLVLLDRRLPAATRARTRWSPVSFSSVSEGLQRTHNGVCHLFGLGVDPPQAWPQT